ncbi:Dihydroxyacetone kinase [Sinomonas atrocyanea]|uniref:Dihydroxyacetone kinase n=3 Tax=Sinomonas atrocyanea TaxID=37927 RepID=A0A127A688_9MICC|nr:dihydroxyacetone kinase family protein [Sinomonas atrocyanea]AMM34145.1 Dihydroxyacetone kinase [Sinomonas atrocyanea]GEB65152.1 D-erythrulose kinase [Sinomonas atrocyanea]
MTRIANDPADFADEALAGFCDVHADLVRQVPGGAVRRRRPARPKVAVLVGGGSGHYPAFAGLIGAGFADGAVVGNIFTSPSTQQACTVARAAETGAGVVFTYGNYAGDVMNFGLASERLAAEGIRAENVLVTDDVASAPAAEADRRRGIAGDFVVFKAMGAAAEAGLSLDEVVRIGRKANSRTRTLGTAFSGCTFPGADAPLFTLPEGHMGLGLGIHGEPGLRDVPLPSAAELGRPLVEGVLAEAPAGEGHQGRIAVILNGLGSTKHEELFVLWGTVAPLLREAGYEIVAPEVGELVTSLDMAGVSLTVTWLDEELEELWLAPAETPAFRRGAVAAASAVESADDDGGPATAVEAPPSSEASRGYAAACVAALEAASGRLAELEAELGAMDAVAGDGDHGRGMVRGAGAAVAAAREALGAGRGAGSVLAAGGDAWADRAGGTSGVLWGAGLRAWGEALGDLEVPDGAQVAAGISAFAARIAALGGAQPGDKTLVDALVPFEEELRRAVVRGEGLAEAWGGACRAAESAAAATAGLTPRKGRARPLAEKSVGTPDPGATSLAAVFAALGPAIVAATQEEVSA